MSFQSPKLGKTILLLILSMAFGLLTPLFVMMLFSVIFQQQPSKLLMQTIILFAEALFVVPILLWAFTRKFRFIDVFRFRKVKIRYLAYSVLAGIGFILASGEIEYIIEMFIPMPDFLKEIEELLKITGWFSGIALITGVGIVGPLAEEMLFRGFFQQSLEKNLKCINMAVIYSALAFMIFHFNIYWALSIFLIGYLLAFITWKTQSVWPAFIIHAINNTLSVFASQYNERIDSIINFHGHLHPGIFLIGLFLLVYFLRKLTRLKTVF